MRTSNENLSQLFYIRHFNGHFIECQQCLGAQRLEKAIAEVTDKPVKWVINTGSQDHRWLGNDYFASKGAEIIAKR